MGGNINYTASDVNKLTKKSGKCCMDCLQSACRDPDNYELLEVSEKLPQCLKCLTQHS